MPLGIIFLTYTCNPKTYFGTDPVKNWIDSCARKNHLTGLFDIEATEKKETEQAMIESSANILLRVWEDPFILFIDYLRKSPLSPLKKLVPYFSEIIPNN